MTEGGCGKDRREGREGQEGRVGRPGGKGGKDEGEGWKDKGRADGGRAEGQREGRRPLSVMPDGSPITNVGDKRNRASSVLSLACYSVRLVLPVSWISPEDGFPLKTCGNDRRGLREGQEGRAAGREGRTGGKGGKDEGEGWKDKGRGGGLSLSCPTVPR